MAVWAPPPTPRLAREGYKIARRRGVLFVGSERACDAPRTLWREPLLIAKALDERGGGGGGGGGGGRGGLSAVRLSLWPRIEGAWRPEMNASLHIIRAKYGENKSSCPFILRVP